MGIKILGYSIDMVSTNYNARKWLKT